MIVKLPFADDSCPVDLRGVRVKPVHCSAPPGAADPAALVACALDRPLEGPSLREISAGGGPATVVVPDATRQVQLPVVLPVILDRLKSGGVAESQTTVLIACGTHPPADDRAIRALVGELPSGVRLVQHDARDAVGLIEVGTIGPTPIRLNRLAVESAVLITVSAVKHHYFAGFGGGPKMIFPGVAGYSEIQANHSKVLTVADEERRRHPRCEPGILDDNPVAQEIARAADLLPPNLALCLVQGRDGRIAEAIAGPWRAAFAVAVGSVRRWYETRPARLFSLAVASGGGAPYDATLIQAHKGLDAACRYLADGGELLFAADLSQGPGSPDMIPFLDQPEPEAILKRLAAGWVQYGHTTLRLLEKTSRCTVHLVSRLDPNTARRLGFNPVDNPAQVIESWRRTRPGDTAAVFTGPAVFPSRA